MFHLDDVVEETATNRPGELDSSDSEFGMPANMWRVRFSDGKEPLSKYFGNGDGLRLVRCPHEPSETTVVPPRSIMEPEP